MLKFSEIGTSVDSDGRPCIDDEAGFWAPERAAQAVAFAAGWQLHESGSVFDSAGGYLASSFTGAVAALLHAGLIKPTKDDGWIPDWAKLDSHYNLEPEHGWPGVGWRVTQPEGWVHEPGSLAGALASYYDEYSRASEEWLEGMRKVPYPHMYLGKEPSHGSSARAAQAVCGVAGWYIDTAGSVYDDTGQYVAESLAQLGRALVQLGYVGYAGYVSWRAIDRDLEPPVQDGVKLTTWRARPKYEPGLTRTTEPGVLGQHVAETVDLLEGQ